MHRLHLLLPLPLLPDQLLDGAREYAPSLFAMTRRGNELELAPSMSGICCEAFGLDKQQDWPVAPLTAKADGLDAEAGYWLRIDPVHLEVGMGGLMLQPPEQLALTAPETEALTTSINAHWRDEGLEIRVPTPSRWYLRLPDLPRLSTTPLDRVAGEYLTPHLPTGDDANRLMRLINVGQMLMHDHPVNQARESRGHLIVNGLWLWGGGVLPPISPGKIDVASDISEVRALAQAVDIQPTATPARWRDLRRAASSPHGLASLSPGAGDHDLVDFLTRLERDWFKPLLRDLMSTRIRRVRVDLLTRPGLGRELDTAQSWRFWR